MKSFGTDYEFILLKSEQKGAAWYKYYVSYTQ